MELELELLKKDRIVKINGYNLVITQDYRIERRNVICHSKILSDILLSKNMDKNILKNTISLTLFIQELLRDNQLHDIVVISINGFY
jgi:hypothetical protein